MADTLTIKSYYREVLKQVRSSLFSFWKAQIGVGLFAGLMTAIVDGFNGVTTRILLVPSVKALFLGYAAALIVALVWSLLRAPFTIHKQEFLLLAAARGVIDNLNAELVRKDEELARKHPHDEHMEGLVRNALMSLDENERRFVDWLLNVGRANSRAVHSGGFHGTLMNSVIAKTGAFLVQFESYRPGNGLVEMDRTYFVNPTAVHALRDVLYIRSTGATQ